MGGESPPPARRGSGEWYGERKTPHHEWPVPQRPPPNHRDGQRRQRPNLPTSQRGRTKPRRPNQKTRKAKQPKPQEPERAQGEEEGQENRYPGKPKKDQPISKPNRKGGREERRQLTASQPCARWAQRAQAGLPGFGSPTQQTGFRARRQPPQRASPVRPTAFARIRLTRSKALR